MRKIIITRSMYDLFFFGLCVCVCQPVMEHDNWLCGNGAECNDHSFHFTQTTRLWFYSSFTLKSFPRPLCLSVYFIALFHFVWDLSYLLCDSMPRYTSLSLFFHVSSTVFPHSSHKQSYKERLYWLISPLFWTKCCFTLEFWKLKCHGTQNRLELCGRKIKKHHQNGNKLSK